MKCVITYTDGTSKEDFIGSGADAVFADLSEVSLEQLLRYLDQKDSDPSHSTTASPPTSVNDEEEKESQSSGHNGNGNGLKAANKKRILRRNSSTHTSEDSTAPSIDDVSSSEIATSAQAGSDQSHQEISSIESTQEENTSSPADSSPSVVKEEESIPSNSSNETVKEEVPNKKLPDDYKVYENGWSLHNLVTTRFFDK